MKVEYINGVPRIKRPWWERVQAWRPRFSLRTILLLIALASVPLYWYSRPEEHGYVHDNAIVCWREFGLLGSQQAVTTVIFLPEDNSPRRDERFEHLALVSRCVQDAKRDQQLHPDRLLWQATSEGIAHVELKGSMSRSMLRRYLSTTPRGERTAEGFAEFCEEVRGDI